MLTFHYKTYASRVVIFRAALQRNTHIHMPLMPFAVTFLHTSSYILSAKSFDLVPSKRQLYDHFVEILKSV